ncbi:hypothetical protein [Chromatium okenii]|jgi:hypothetical protein|uniref:hypothetical protein n=1 Tax=Chromatium okenii TaxID=61644 RepID=UPI0026F17370|nr:hypothetical protein [Chromatium okenii]MBV5309813.1 hypothetical protein [Chromatium okenii]
MNQRSCALDYTVWHDDFFPPSTFKRSAARAAGMLALFLIWVALSILISIGLMHLNFSLETAGFLAVMIPPGIVVMLNIAGAFNRPRGQAKHLKKFKKWILSAAGQRHGLQLAHLAEVQVSDSCHLRIIVTSEWLRQSPEKQLADINYWYVLWNWCHDDGGIHSELELTVIDAVEQCVGAAHSRDGGTRWIAIQP